jgi:hypothetical protein
MKKTYLILAAAMFALISTVTAQTSTPTPPGSYPENKENRKAKRQANATITKSAHDTVKTNRAETSAENKANVQEAKADGVVTKEEAKTVHTENSDNRKATVTENAPVKKSAASSRKTNRRSAYSANKANRRN